MSENAPLGGTPAPASSEHPVGAPPERAERLWACYCHVGGLAWVLPIPFAHVVAVLVLWLLKKDEWLFVNDQGKEALDFQLSVAAYTVGSLPLCVIRVGFILLVAIAVLELVLVIRAAIRASEGVRFRYPGCIRFLP